MSDGWGNPIVGGTTLRIPAIQSVNFVHLVSGWQITADGNAEFNEVQARGEFFLTGDGGSEIAILLISGLPVIELIPESVTQMSTPPQILSQSVNPGNVNEGMILTLSSGKSNGNDDAGLQLFDQNADGSGFARHVFEFGGDSVAVFSRSGLALLPIVTPGPTPGLAQLFCYSNGSLAVTDGIDGNVYQTEGLVQNLAANTGSLTALTTIFTVNGGARTYKIHAVLYVDAAAGAQLTLEISVPTGALGKLSYQVSRSTSFIGSVVGNLNASVGLAVALGNLTGYLVTFDAIVTPSSAGPINLQAGSLNANAVVIEQYSFWEVTPV